MFKLDSGLCVGWRHVLSYLERKAWFSFEPSIFGCFHSYTALPWQLLITLQHAQHYEAKPHRTHSRRDKLYKSIYIVILYIILSLVTSSILPLTQSKDYFELVTWWTSNSKGMFMTFISRTDSKWSNIQVCYWALGATRVLTRQK